MLEGPLPPLGELEVRVQQTLPEKPPPQNQSSLAAYRALVSELRKEGVEMAAILYRLRERGYQGSYSAVRRFVSGPVHFGRRSLVHIGVAIPGTVTGGI